MNIVDWTTAPGAWPEIGPEIAAVLKRIATMPLEELRAMPEPPFKTRLFARWYEPSIADVQSAVCEKFEITRAEMLSDMTTKDITIPRQIAMHLARTLTHKSFSVIGRAFNRDHSTVSFACRGIMGRPELWSVIAQLRAELAP